MNIKPLSDLEAIDFKQLEQESLELARGVPQWGHFKTYDHDGLQTQTLSKTFGDDFWVARFNILDEDVTAKYGEKFDKLLIGDVPIDLKDNHTTHERKYIHQFYDFEIKELNQDTYLIKTYYNIPFPFRKRNFHNLVHIVKKEDYSMVISLSIDPKIFGHDNAFVVGNYTSIELVEKKDGKLHWTMATSSNPNGHIPGFLTRMSLPGAISEDVPSFLQYCDNYV